MIRLDSVALKHSGLPSNIMAFVVLMLHSAGDGPNAKPNEALAYDFLLSFKGKAKIDLMKH